MRLAVCVPKKLMGRGHSSSRRVRDANAMNDQPASLSHQLVPAVGKGIHRLAIARKLLSQSGTGIRSFKPSGECPPLYDVLDPERIAHDHLGLINSYDLRLGSALTRYYAADRALRDEASHYKPNLEIPGSNEALRRCAFDLEIASDELERAVERRSQITKNG